LRPRNFSRLHDDVGPPLVVGVIMDVVVWLRSLGLGKYEAVFRENEIDETVLQSLTHETLKELGVTAVGHRLKLLDAIAALRGSETQGRARVTVRAWHLADRRPWLRQPALFQTERPNPSRLGRRWAMLARLVEAHGERSRCDVLYVCWHARTQTRRHGTSAVLQLHTAIEDVLTGWITCRMLGVRPDNRKRARTVPARALRKLLSGAGGLGFERKLSLAVVLGLITPKIQRRLEDLNHLRNRCSHNWLLRTPLRRGRKPKEKKPPLLLYRGRDLHKVAVLKDMTAEYGPLYAKLFVKYLDG
jgi:hypothetical protein